MKSRGLAAEQQLSETHAKMVCTLFMPLKFLNTDIQAIAEAPFRLRPD